MVANSALGSSLSASPCAELEQPLAKDGRAGPQQEPWPLEATQIPGQPRVACFTFSLQSAQKRLLLTGGHQPDRHAQGNQGTSMPTHLHIEALGEVMFEKNVIALK